MSNREQAIKEFKQLLVEIACQYNSNLIDDHDTYTGIMSGDKISIASYKNDISDAIEFAYVQRTNGWIVTCGNWSSGTVSANNGGLLSGYCQTLFTGDPVVLN